METYIKKSSEEVAVTCPQCGNNLQFWEIVQVAEKRCPDCGEPHRVILFLLIWAQCLGCRVGGWLNDGIVPN